jgi:hypothetical protein
VIEFKAKNALICFMTDSWYTSRYTNTFTPVRKLKKRIIPIENIVFDNTERKTTEHIMKVG